MISQNALATWALATCLASAPTLCQAASLTTIHVFKGADGGEPTGLLIHMGGKLYGTTYIGGLHASGTVFAEQPDGHHVVRHDFAGGTDGSNPYGGLVPFNGAFYGTTQKGGGTGCGGVGCGTIYTITQQGDYTQLYAFQGAADGYAPNATLVALGGLLYGSTRDGGANNGGTVFSVSPQGMQTTLHAFGGKPDGTAPTDLITDGTTLYGTTIFGGKGCGTSGCGTVFAMDPQGNESILYAFASGKDGEGPSGRLLRLGDTFYGTTVFGGAAFGTVFSVSQSGKHRLLHAFDGTDGQTPYAGLTELAGTLYGTTTGGGTDEGGTLFAITTQGDFSTLYDFTGAGDGDSPVAELLAYHGTLYGTTSFGGGKGRKSCGSIYCGTIFTFTP